MSKNVRKKAIHMKRRIRLDNIITKGYCVVTLNSKKAVAFDIEANNLVIKMSPTLIKAMITGTFRWGVTLIVGCKESNGKSKVVQEYIGFQDPHTQEELKEYITQEHDALIEECASKMKVEYVGWIASPHRVEFEPAKSQAILEKLNQYWLSKE